MSVSLHIVYESRLGKRLTVVTTCDKDLIIEAAKRAIEEAYESADAMFAFDDIVAQAQKEEAERLKRILILLIPELQQGLEINKEGKV